ncbi:MAG: hypothetical protein RIR43_759 [Pseudomonadota bacterium]|jgi:sigma-E factor negative regulatory protein RseA
MGEHRNEDPSRARLSAIMDGQADPADVQRWLQHEAPQAAVQEDWHTYHLIGDALRSGDLASSPARDRRLLNKVQQALSEEPVVLAPGAAASTGAVQRPIRRRLWAAAAAGVAGFAVVAGAFFTTRAEWGDLPVIAWAPSGGPSSEDFRRASVGSPGPDGSPALTGSTQAPFREILRLPRGPAQRPLESLQVLYSNGSATISVLMEPYRPGEHQPKVESSERLNTLSVQRQDLWLTLSGDVPLGTLQQMALAFPARP